MATTFSGFLVELSRLLTQDENSPTDLPIATLQQVISLGERRLYREVRSRHNEKSFDPLVTIVTSNLAPIPADFEAASVLHFGRKALEPVAEDVIRAYNVDAFTGECKYFAQAGANFTFSPIVANTTPVQGRYFYRLPALDVTTTPTNALFLAEQDLFTYVCLCESAPIFGQDARAALWEANYAQVLREVNRGHHRAAYSAGRMRIRASVPVLV